MKRSDVQQIKLPDSPGVYFFLGKERRILYIGKATSLRDRVRSYFNSDVLASRGPLISQMIDEAAGVDYVRTDSVLEALILEANLIKKHKPRFNTREKDDKSFNYVIFTKEEFPRVLTIRGKDLPAVSPKDVKYVFGPFPQGKIFKEAMRIIRKIFQFRDTCTPVSLSSGKSLGKPCFNRQIGLCPGVCTGEVTRVEYARLVQHLKLFFEGKKSALVRQLEKEMKMHAKRREFEKAAELKHKIFALTHIQDISLLKEEYKEPRGGAVRIEAYDIAHISGESTTGVMVVVTGTEPVPFEYRKFRIRGEAGNNDVASLREVLSRRLGHPEWEFPRIIVIDGGKAQKNAAEKVLEEFGFQIAVVSVVKNEQHKPERILGNAALIRMHEREILLANSEAHRFAIKYHRQLRGKL